MFIAFSRRSRPTRSFCDIHLPYCLHRLKTGHYIAVNRRYLPLGETGRERVDYDSLAPAWTCEFKPGVGPDEIAAISVYGDPSSQRIHLYRESCIPCETDADWLAYGLRLAALERCMVLHAAPPSSGVQA